MPSTLIAAVATEHADQAQAELAAALPGAALPRGEAGGLAILRAPIDVGGRAAAAAWRRELAAALRAPVELAIRGPEARPAALVLMDMDSTAIAIEVIDELARAHGVGASVAAITERAMRGELDFAASLRARVAQLAGLPAATLDELAANLPLSPGMAELVAGCHERGVRVAIASGGFTFAADALVARLGLLYAEANRLEIVDGALTGAVTGAIVTAERKAALVDELAARLGVDAAAVVAVGDGANDRAMLARAGLGVAFHGKPALVAVADGAIAHGGLDRILAFLD